jgi:hypothetical protein
MSTAVEKIVAEALALGPEARALVAERLIESLDIAPDAEISPAWREELGRRCREIDDAAVTLHDAAEVFARAHAALE